MLEKSTDELNELLAGVKPGGINRCLKENEAYLASGKKAFYFYFKDITEKKGIKLKDLYTIAGVSESYGGKIVTMEKHTKDRDLIIRLCLAGHFTWIETSRALRLYGMSELYAKDPRDACIIVAINNRVLDPLRVNELLEKHGMEKLN